MTGQDPDLTGPFTPPRRASRIAICGPGREVVTALVLAVHGETVDDIQVSRHLPDPSMIFVITDAPFELPPFPDFTGGIRTPL